MSERSPAAPTQEQLVAAVKQHMHAATAEARGGKDSGKLVKETGLAWGKLCTAYKEDVPADKLAIFTAALREVNASMPELAPLVDEIMNLYTRMNTATAHAQKNNMISGLLSLAYQARAGIWRQTAALGMGMAGARTETAMRELKKGTKDETSWVQLQKEFDELMKKIWDLNDRMETVRQASK
jgi:hypothetical protein